MDEDDLVAFDYLVNDAENDIEDPIGIGQSPNEDANDNVGQNGNIVDGTSSNVSAAAVSEHDQSTENGVNCQNVAENNMNENIRDDNGIGVPIGIEQSANEDANDENVDHSIVVATGNNGQALENSHSDNLNGTKVTEKIDDEIEITYVLGQKIFARAEDPYEVKKNDVFSGNRPFKEVCNFDFPCYYILCHSLKNCFFRTKQKEPTWCWSTVNTKASK